MFFSILYPESSSVKIPRESGKAQSNSRRPEDGAAFENTLTCVTWMYERMDYSCKH